MMKITPFLLAALIVLCAFSDALAHRLNVFAWLENDEIIVESNFGKDRPARDAVVTIIDEATRRTLASGRTNSVGQYVFKVPSVVREGHGLVIDVNAGQGHHREWTMDASELYAAASLTAGFDASAIEQREQDQKAGIATPEATPSIPPAPAIASPADETLTPDRARSIIREEVEKSVAPLRQRLASRGEEGPSLAEIIGGIGWIVGIIGVYLIFRSRRKTS
ncbi:MAG: cobalamin biosynthesis protein CbiL [Desulfovibrio sp.]|nr:cobalamin biosynthesis protein CbiL [Desulfovibrio sp.]